MSANLSQMMNEILRLTYTHESDILIKGGLKKVKPDDVSAYVFNERFEFIDEFRDILRTDSDKFDAKWQKELMEFKILKGLAKICLLRAKFECLYEHIVNKFIFQEIILPFFILDNDLDYGVKII